jgi:hypothetical protein
LGESILGNFTMDENLKKLIMLYKEGIHETCSHFLDKNIWGNYTWMKSKKLKVFGELGHSF